MADQFDNAQRIDQLMTESARAHQAKLAASEPKLDPTGECQNPMCGEPVEPPRLFCNAKCASEHARRK